MRSEARPSADTKWPYLISLAFLCVAVFAITTIPINSNDFWWHLKSGHYILEEKKLPEADPLTYTTPPHGPDAPGRFTLTQYWLAQTAYAALYNGFGLKGIIAARGLLYVLFALLAAFLCLPFRRAALITLPLFAVSTLVSLEDSDRPQTFSYLFALLAVANTEWAIRKKTGWRLYLNAPMMLVASNMHAGFTVGLLYLLVYSVLSPFEERLKPFWRPLLLSTALSFLASYMNPNHWQAFDQLLIRTRPAATLTESSAILEYKFPHTILPYVLSTPHWLSYWALVLLSAPAAIFHLWKKQWSTGVLLAGTTAASLFAMKLAFFFAPLGAAFSARFIEETVLFRVRQKRAAETIAFIFLIILIGAWIGNPNTLGIRETLQPMTFPVRAASFIASKRLPQPVFNNVNWGGYLEWRLMPEYRMFLDTRFLTGRATSDYNEIMSYTPKGRQLLESYGIATVITPAIEPYAGRIVPIVRGLYEDPRWSVVYSDGQAIIFVREGLYPEKRPKQEVYFEVLSEVKYWRPIFSWVPAYENTEREAMEKLGLR